MSFVHDHPDQISGQIVTHLPKLQILWKCVPALNFSVLMELGYGVFSTPAVSPSRGGVTMRETVQMAQMKEVAIVPARLTPACKISLCNSRRSDICFP